MTKATKNITAKVTMGRASATAKLKSGGMKKNSNDTTLRMAASSDGPYPNRIETMTTPSRKTMTTSVRCHSPKTNQARRVDAVTVTTAEKKPRARPGKSSEGG